jgi:hypoxanthine-guanine phosphoribosyltransferase
MIRTSTNRKIALVESIVSSGVSLSKKLEIFPAFLAKHFY